MATTILAFVTLLTVCGLVYMALSLMAARSFVHRLARSQAHARTFAPDVTLLKPVKGLDHSMYAALASHCRQQYSGNVEIIFGVNSAEDPAIAEIDQLRSEFPGSSIQVLVCPQRLGTSGKVSNLVQMLPLASHDFIIVNDSDILVSPMYLSRVMTNFADEQVGMVTAPYLGRATTGDRGISIWSKLEALGISTDFFPGVLTARMLEGGLRFGLGSTLAMRKSALRKAGGLEPLLEYLADDYELGARIAASGYRVELCGEVVETIVPAYDWKGFLHHQMRWARSTRDSRKLGYVGMGVTYCLPWAIFTCVASGFDLWSLTLLSLVLLVRVAVALTVGVGILRDRQVLRELWLLPLRDLFGLCFWLWSFAGDTVVWRGERFVLRSGRLFRAESAAGS